MHPREFLLLGVVAHTMRDELRKHAMIYDSLDIDESIKRW